LITAAEIAWTATFKGDGANILIATIADYLSKKRDVYTRHSSIVNSSGTGKSRIVDQVAKKIITVPICLREDENETQGFNLCLLFRHAHDMIHQDSLRLMKNFVTGLLKNNPVTKSVLRRSYMHSCAHCCVSFSTI
jgi:hypothetical protein